MSSEIRVCPHCGASVGGDTDQCPNCDGWLTTAPIVEDDLAHQHEAVVFEDVRPPEAESKPHIALDIDTDEFDLLKEATASGSNEEDDTPHERSHHVRPRPSQPVPPPDPLPPSDTQPKILAAPIPPAPFTPPPSKPVTQRSPAHWMQSRIQAYLYGGYQLQVQNPREAVLSYGKSLSFAWWIVGTASIVGTMWYMLLLLLSGFRRDQVYIFLEPDGAIFEEGPGAAHIRRQRARVGRRWGMISILIGTLSVITFLLVVLALSILVGRYEAELNAAYPEFGLFDSSVDPDTLDATEVQNVRVIVLVLGIMLALSTVGFLGGTALFFISHLHAAAYRVEVAPLPNHR